MKSFHNSSFMVKQRASTPAIRRGKREDPVHRRLEAERARLFAQVSEGRQRLQALSRSLLEAQEVERRELARDLHDEIGQALTALKVNLQGFQRLEKRVATSAIMDDSIQIVDRMLTAVRNLALDLRPSLLDDLGLGPAARWYLRRQAARFNWRIECIGQAIHKRYSEALEIACFRVVQESVTNIGRHANATRVRVSLYERKGVLALQVRDNGIGFNPMRALAQAKKGKSLGLVGMGERVRLVNGKISVVSSPGVGTVVRASFPVAQLPPLERRKAPR